jgi:hypothetical protein
LSGQPSIIGAPVASGVVEVTPALVGPVMPAAFSREQAKGARALLRLAGQGAARGVTDEGRRLPLPRIRRIHARA